MAEILAAGGGSDSQTLNIVGQALTILNGNTVTLPAATATVDNGLNINGSDIHLGGKLKETTIIEGGHPVEFTNDGTSTYKGKGTIIGHNTGVHSGSLDANNLTASTSWSFGTDLKQSGDLIFSAGQDTDVDGQNTSAIGTKMTVAGNYSHMLGYGLTARGNHLHFVGRDIRCDGSDSVLLGMNIEVNGKLNFALGNQIAHSEQDSIMIAGKGQKLGFFNTTPAVKPSGTPPAATDLATTMTLLNYIRDQILINYGLMDT